MKRKLIIVINVILILIALKFVYNIVINNILITKYNDNEYNEDYGKALTFINFLQRYVANYNYGNILYKNAKYEEAIEEYKKALNEIVPKEKECSIRINYALAICKTVQVDEEDSESIKNAINTYESAIDILTENGCANKNDDNGHSKKAEQLKKDIQKEIERLKNLKKLNKDDEENDEDEEKEDNNEQEVETIENKIQDIKENAIQDQRELESQYKNYGNFDYNKTERNW